MRIEMELVNGSTTSNHSQIHTPLSLSLSSSFTRSTSLLTINDRIRRGLRKRVARQWISWAESWCMQLWEDGGWDKGAERRNALLLGGESVKRVKVNVRPIVRRIGDPIPPPEKETSLITTSAKSTKSKSTKKNGWKNMRSSSGDSSSCEVERWMSGEENEDECGVEVTFTFSEPQQSSISRLGTACRQGSSVVP